MKKLLFQFDTDPLPAVFDNVVGYDGGADHISAYGGIGDANVGGVHRPAVRAQRLAVGRRRDRLPGRVRRGRFGNRIHDRAGPAVSRNDAQAVAIRMRLVVPARPNGIPAMTTMV